MKYKKGLFISIAVLFLTSWVSGMDKKKSWVVKAKTGEDFTFKCIDLSLSDMNTCAKCYVALGNVFARAFAPLYPEAGLEIFAKKSVKATQLKKSTDMSEQEKSLQVADIIQKNKKEVIQYALEYFLDSWKKMKNIKKILGLIGRGEFYPIVAFKKDKPVGFALFKDSYVYKDKYLSLGDNVKHLHILAIDPHEQKKGLSRDLIFSILKLFPETKRIKLRTDVRPDIVTGKPKNLNACSLYTYLGFRVDEELINKFYKWGRDQFFVWSNCNILSKQLEFSQEELEKFKK